MNQIEKANAVLEKINAYNGLCGKNELKIVEGEKRCAIVKINKEISKELQSLNFSRNRNMRPDRISEYAKEMAGGRWGLSTDAIGIDDEGQMINAQHRTGAVVSSDTEQEFLIVVGIPHDAVMYIDGGIKRSVSDQLKIAKEDALYGNKASASLVKAISYTKLDGGRRINSSYEVEKLISKYYWICKYFVSHRGHRKMSNAVVYVSLFSALGLKSISLETMEDFLDCVGDGTVDPQKASRYNYTAAVRFKQWYDKERDKEEYDARSAIDVLMNKAEKAIWCFSNNVMRKNGEGVIYKANGDDLVVANEIVKGFYDKSRV